MNLSAESLFPGFSAGIARQIRMLRLPQSPFTTFRHKVTANPLAFFATGAALIAAHLLIVIFQPPQADAYIYLLLSIACGMEASILLIHARSNTGQVSLRWMLLALGFCVYVLIYLWAGVGLLTKIDAPTVNVVFQVLLSSCFLLALTLPSEEQHKQERVLDFSVVLVFGVLRFLFLHIVVPPDSAHTMERMTLESGVRVLLAFLGFMAASAADRKFFRVALIVMSAMFIGIICENEIGVVLLHQDTNSPWALTDTVERVSDAVFFLWALSRQETKVEARTYRAALGSIVPFIMTAFVVFLAATLLPTHPYIGYGGVVFGVSAFLLRVGLMSHHRKPEIVIEESLVREIASEIMKDPLYGLADRYGLEPALAFARSTVNALAPLALILFAIEETAHGIEVLTDEAESRNLVLIARVLNHWHTSDSTICYLGSGRFAMLLPQTPLRIAMSLAEQVCLSVDSLDLTGEEGPMAIMAGVAACTEPSRVSGLLHTSSTALERAHVHRESRVRTTPLRGEAIFDA